MSNKARLQDGTYREIRTRYQIPVQMACSIPRQVGATYQLSLVGFFIKLPPEPPEP